MPGKITVIIHNPDGTRWEAEGEGIRYTNTPYYCDLTVRLPGIRIGQFDSAPREVIDVGIAEEVETPQIGSNWGQHRIGPGDAGNSE